MRVKFSCHVVKEKNKLCNAPRQPSCLALKLGSSSTAGLLFSLLPLPGSWDTKEEGWGGRGMKGGPLLEF